MSEKSIREHLLDAVFTLLRDDAYLLEIDAAERILCGRLAVYLQAALPDLHVDVEYNRHIADIKRLNNLDDCQSIGGRVFPDLIVHDRGNDDSNLLVLEVKKSTNDSSRACDYAKLKGFVADYGYQFAVFLEIPTGIHFGGEPKIDWIMAP